MPEHSKLEEDIALLEKAVRAERERADQPSVSHKEIIRTALRERIQAPPVSPSRVPTSAPQGSTDVASDFLPDYAVQSPPAIRLTIEQLIDLAWHKGIVEASSAAGKLGPFYLDAFHDALTEKLYDELKKRGFFK